MTDELKCAHAVCERTTCNPRADGWSYLADAPPELPHWVGWWCPPCIRGLERLMAARGVEPTIEHLQ
jgi:hypothetical protein